MNLVNPAPRIDLSVCLSSPKNEPHCLALIQRVGKAILLDNDFGERKREKSIYLSFRFLGLLENQGKLHMFKVVQSISKPFPQKPNFN